MVLYGYDAAVFNAAQNSTNWLNWFDLDLNRDGYLIGLINTSYTIGAIVAGWFMGGPIVSHPSTNSTYARIMGLSQPRPIALGDELAWELAAS
jgi:hypothetical protein